MATEAIRTKRSGAEHATLGGEGCRSGFRLPPSPRPLRPLRLSSSFLYPSRMESAVLTIAELLADELPPGALPGELAAHRSRPSADSRQVQAGDLFFALAENVAQRTAHVAEATQRGAAAVVAAAGTPAATTLCTVSSPRRAHAQAVYRAAGVVGRHPPLLAVTGTDGKTSVAWMTWRCLGLGAARVGTLGNHDGRHEVGGTHTTPPPEAFATLLAGLAPTCPGIAIEVSSHAAAQHRLGRLPLAALALTGIGHDHLDYHRTQADYAEAKLSLIDTLPASSLFITNADDASTGPAMARAAARGVRRLALGFAGGEARIVGRPDAWSLQSAGSVTPLPIQGPGRFRAWNAAAAMLLAGAIGIAPTEAAARLAGQADVPGRLELVLGRPAAYVDYAHTPLAITRVLAALREHHPGRRLVCVFGCGGERDRSKRPLMARAALAADLAIVTADNPRREGQDAIAADIYGSLSSAEHARLPREDDRGTAIARGLREAGPDGVLAVLGKGHEGEQVVGTVKIPWDDREALRRLGGAA